MAESDISKISSNIFVVWLDTNIETSKENQDTKIQLRQTVQNRCETFIDPDECLDFITSDHVTQVSLIVSNSSGSRIVPLIYQVPQIQSIYVFCVSKERAEEWATPNFKIAGIFTDKKALIEKIRCDILACDNSTHIPMSIFHCDDTQKSLRNLNGDSVTFMWFQLLIVVLERLAGSLQSKNEMITESLAVYDKDPIEQEKIKKFELEYRASKAIWWYTCDCFAYRLLNKALRTQNIDIIFRFRFFINDLTKGIKSLYKKYLNSHQPVSNHHLTLFRGQQLPIEDIIVLKGNVNGLISMNTFLSATRNKNLALIYADTGEKVSDTSPIQPVLFIIDIFNVNRETTPFAPIKSHSCYAAEDEILFTIGAVFCVTSVEQTDDIWHVHLRLSRQDNESNRHLFNHIVQQIGDKASPLTLGWFLYRMNEYDKAERYAETLLKQLAVTDRNLGDTYNLLGLIYKDIDRLTDSIKSYEQALHIYSSISPPNTSQIIATHYNLGLAYLASGDREHAIEHHGHAECKLINSSQSKDPLLSAMRESLKAKLEAQHGEHESALKILQSVLTKKKKKLPPEHPSIASTLKEMGILQAKMKHHDEALELLNEALTIFRKTLVEKHLDAKDCHEQIGHIYQQQKKYELAIKEFETAVEIIQRASRYCIKSVKELRQCIDETKRMMNDVNKAD